MSIPKCKDFSDYNRYPSDPNPTTNADMQEYMANQNELMQIIAGMLWQPKTVYEKDQQIMSNSLPSGTVAIVQTPGISGEAEPVWGELNEEVADGTVVWKVSRQKGGDGIVIGTICSWPGTLDNIPAGFLLCDGAEYATDGIAKPLFNVIGYTYGGSGSKFKVPNLIGKWVKGDTVAGQELEAGLPNIKGKTELWGLSENFEGAVETVSKGVVRAVSDGGNAILYTVTTDASRVSNIYRDDCDTVQPPSLTAIPIIKAFNADVEPIEPTTEQQLRNEIAQHSGEIADIKNNLGLQMDLLWTNANLSTAFTPQTLSMDLTQYKIVYIIFVELADGGTRSATKVSQLASVGDKVLLQAQYPLGFSVSTRFCTVNRNGIVFEGGYVHNTLYDNAPNNQQCVPYKIYGIK